MSEHSKLSRLMPASVDGSMVTAAGDVLTGILREGAQRLLAQAIHAEVDDWIGQHAGVRDDKGRQQVVKNVHHPRATLVTGVGPVEVTQPRVLDRRIAGRDENGEDLDAEGRPVERFRSSILPPYQYLRNAVHTSFNRQPIPTPIPKLNPAGP